MKIDKGLKILFGGLIVAITLMFILIASSVDAHEYRDYHRGYSTHHGHHIYPEHSGYCPGRWMSDDYNKLLEKQRQEREEFLKKQRNIEKGGKQQ